MLIFTICFAIFAVVLCLVTAFLYKRERSGIQKKIDKIQLFFQSGKPAAPSIGYPFVGLLKLDTPETLSLDYSGEKLEIAMLNTRVEISIYRKNRIEFIARKKGSDYKDLKNQILTLKLLQTHGSELSPSFEIYSGDDSAMGRMLSVRDQLELLGTKGVYAVEAGGHSIKLTAAYGDGKSNLDPENLKFIFERLLEIVGKLES